jgi:hypothetical protein
LACAQALPNRRAKAGSGTRGFTSCRVFPDADGSANVTCLFLCLRTRKH